MFLCCEGGDRGAETQGCCVISILGGAQRLIGQGCPQLNVMWLYSSSGFDRMTSRDPFQCKSLQLYYI